MKINQDSCEGKGNGIYSEISDSGTKELFPFFVQEVYVI